MVARGKPVLSSVLLQVLLNLDAYYLPLFFVAEILLVIYKAENLHYPNPNVAIDVSLVFILCFVEMLRIFFGMKGNLTERVMSTLVSIFFLVVSAVLVVYFAIWQTFVLRVDLVICGILLVLQALQLIFSLVAMCTFAMSPAI